MVLLFSGKITEYIQFSGKVHTLGRAEYGRLGIGEKVTEKNSPQLVGVLADKKTVNVSCGTATSFAVLDSGKITFGVMIGFISQNYEF